MKRILAAIDFSDVTAAVVERAAELAKAFLAELTLLHATAPDPEFVGYEPGPQTVRDSRALEVRSEHRDLENLAQSLTDQGIQAKAKLAMGPMVMTILEHADALNADLIVLGSHGHGALYKALVGSVTEGVIRKSSCPVLIVPASKDDDA